jgi:hypothetical protein
MNNAEYELWNGKWDDELMCHLLKTYVQTEDGTVFLRIGDDDCVDMDGAIAMAERLCPGVLSVLTIQRGAKPGDLDIPDTAYHRETVDSEWYCIPHTEMQKRLSDEQIVEIMAIAWNETDQRQAPAAGTADDYQARKEGAR